MLVRRLLLALTVVLLTLPSLAATPLQQRLDKLQEKYRCQITAYLRAIRARPLTVKHRFLIIERMARSEYYVQCLFYDNDSNIDCEAVSGYYNPDLTGFATPAQLAALAALGFSTDASAGNFAQQRPVPNDGALYDIAGMLVETLVRVYDLQIDDLLVFHAPLVPFPPPPRWNGDRHCPALIGAVDPRSTVRLSRGRG